MNTAVNPGCDWLFPGGRAGQPLTAGALLQQLHVLGVHVTQTRTAAFRQLVLQAPPPSSPRPSATPPELPKTMSATAAGHGAATRLPAPSAPGSDLPGGQQVFSCGGAALAGSPAGRRAEIIPPAARREWPCWQNTDGQVGELVA